MSDLTAKQQAFVEEYLVDLNATQAAIRAGYSPDTAQQMGSENLSKPVIATAIAELMAERSKRTEITAFNVLGDITTIKARCMQTSPVIDKAGNHVMIETEDGEIVPAYKFDPTNALKANELLGKHLGMFTDKHEIGGIDGAPVIFSMKIVDADKTD